MNTSLIIHFKANSYTRCLVEEFILIDQHPAFLMSDNFKFSRIVRIPGNNENPLVSEPGSSIDGGGGEIRNGTLAKHNRRVLLRATRRFTFGPLSAQYLIGRKRYNVNQDKKI
jgi:hypothetical protein